jgi:hypothetical protein
MLFALLARSGPEFGNGIEHRATRTTICQQSRWSAGLKTLDRDDLEMLIRGVKLDDENTQVWRKDPGTYITIAANSVYTLVQRDFAPIEIRMKHVIDRETLFPNCSRVPKSISI